MTNPTSYPIPSPFPGHLRILFVCLYFTLLLSPFHTPCLANVPPPPINNNHLETQAEKMTGRERLNILVQLALSYSNREPRKVLKYGQAALELLRDYPDTRLHIQVINALSSAHMDRGHLDTAAAYVKKSIELATDSGNQENIADAFLIMGKLQWRLNNYPKATDYLTRSLSIYQLLNNPKGQAQTKNILGLVYWRTGNYSRALELLLDALSISEKLNDLHWNARIQNNIAIIYFETNDLKKSKTFFLKSLQLLRSLNDNAGTAKTLNNIALIYAQQNQFSQALDYFSQSIHIKNNLGIKDGVPATLTNIGSLYDKMGNTSKALEFFDQGLQLANSINDQPTKQEILINIGQIYRKKGLLEKARLSVENALELSTHFKNTRNSANALLELSKIHQAMNNHLKALHYFKLYKNINDSIFNDDNQKKITELQSRFNIENTEEAIQLLERDNQIDAIALANQQNITLSLILISFFILLLVLGLYLRHRADIKLNEILKKEANRHQETMKKFRTQEEEFRQLAEKSFVGILILQNWKIQYANPSILNIFGYTMQEFIGHSPLDFIHPSDHEKMKNRITERMQYIRTIPWFEFKALTRNGQIRYLESLAEDFTYHGQPALLASLIDITNRKKTGQTLLTSRKLESIGIMAGGIAHDFNNLLSIIIGYIEMLKDDFPPYNTHCQNSLKQMESAALQAADLCRKLSIFSKNTPRTYQKVDLNTSLNDILDLYPAIRPLVKPLPHSHESYCFYAVERHFSQLLTNLLLNAYEAGPGPDNAPLAISLSAQYINLDDDNPFALKKGKYINLSLSDNGKGIPPHLLKHVFEPFFSTKKTGNPANTTGTGLGLTICYAIVHQHGGDIHITSEPGVGTTVNLTLPAYDEMRKD